MRPRIRQWITRYRKTVWSEPALPPYIKINPDAGPAAGPQGFQPGDISMGRIAADFLADDSEYRQDMSLCPECGEPPETTTQNTATGQPVYRCANYHDWPAGEPPPTPPPASSSSPAP